MTRRKRCRGHLEIRIFLHGGFDHRLECVGFDVAQVVVRAFDFKAEARGEILLVADHHVHILRDFAVHFLRFLQAADGFPERRAIVQIVADDDAVLLRRLHRFDGECGGGFRQRGKNAAGVQPARANFAENMIPIEIARLELRRGGIAAVRHADRAADAEAALGEIQAVANAAADAVVWRATG